MSKSRRASSTRPVTAIWPGRQYPRGANWDGEGVNFSLFSASATRVELCTAPAPRTYDAGAPYALAGRSLALLRVIDAVDPVLKPRAPPADGQEPERAATPAAKPA